MKKEEAHYTSPTATVFWLCQTHVLRCMCWLCIEPMCVKDTSSLSPIFTASVCSFSLMNATEEPCFLLFIRTLLPVFCSGAYSVSFPIKKQKNYDLDVGFHAIDNFSKYSNLDLLITTIYSSLQQHGSMVGVCVRARVSVRCTVSHRHRAGKH